MQLRTDPLFWFFIWRVLLYPVGLSALFVAPEATVAALVLILVGRVELEDLASMLRTRRDRQILRVMDETLGTLRHRS
jgi:hypothetical protein